MLRLPVQIGATGLASLARAAAFVFPGGVLILPALYALGAFGIDSEYLSLLVAGPPFFLLFFGIRDLKRAYAQQPVDLWFDTHGFTICGGRHDGTRVESSSVKAWVVEAPRRDELAELHRLRVDVHTGAPLYLAATALPTERAMLESMARALGSLVVTDEAEPAATETPVAWTDARVAGRVYRGAAALLFCAWPLGIFFIWFNTTRNLWTWRGACLVLLLTVGCGATVFALLRPVLASRQLARDLVMRQRGMVLPDLATPESETRAYTFERRGWHAAAAAAAGIAIASGWALHRGLGRDAQTNQLHKQCDANDQRACVALGQRYPFQNRRRAEQLFTAACDRGVVEGCSRLGDLWSLFPYTETRPLLDIRRKACDLGSGDACKTLGDLLDKGDYFKRIQIDLPASTAAYARGCALASAGACTDWGYALSLGRGAESDPVEEARAYRRACDLGSPVGCNNLGAMYEKGDGGLEVDRSRAMALYTRACDAHVDLGCRNRTSLARRR